MEPFIPRDHVIASRLRRMYGAPPPHADPALDRIRRGYYKSRSAVFNTTQDHLLRIMATADARGEDIVFSHASAAILLDAPVLNADLTWVHATRPGKAQRTAAGVKVHRQALTADDIVEVAGLKVTSPRRTAIDLARSMTLPNALLPLDRLLGLANPDPRGDPAAAATLAELLEVIGPRSRGAHILRHTDARSGSAGESLSRGQMHLIGVPMPELQQALPRADGSGVDIIDFDWPELATFGEMDGKGKYFDVEMIGDRDPRDVLWEEKQREDRIRLHRPRGVRWDWSTALSRTALAARLAAVGIGAHRTSTR